MVSGDLPADPIEDPDGGDVPDAALGYFLACSLVVEAQADGDHVPTRAGSPAERQGVGR